MPEVFTGSRHIKGANACLAASEVADKAVYADDKNKINCIEVPPLPPKRRSQSIGKDNATASVQPESL